MRDIQSISGPRGHQKLRNILSVSIPALTIAAGLVSSDAAFAQTKIEQMIVTAQKRSQDLQTVPASISAFSGEELQSRQINDVRAVLSSVPNVTWAMAAASTPVIAIRGVSPDASNGTIDPAIAMNIDGVYQPRPQNVFLGMLDLESVEVLRGPQGTLYGRNANAGVLNLNTHRPTDTFEASATVMGGSYNHYGAKGYVSGPVFSDKVEMRLAVLADQHQGWGKNILNGSRMEASKEYGGRLSIRLKPIDDVTVDLIGSYGYTHGRGARYNLFPYNSANYNTIVGFGGNYALATTDTWRSAAGGTPEQWFRTQAFTGIVTWDITPDISLKSISGLQHFANYIYFDTDTLPFNFLYTDGDQRSSTFSQEFDLNAKLFDRVDAVLGLYYLKDHNNGGTRTIFYSGGGTPKLVPTTNPFVQQNLLNQWATSKAIFLDTTTSIIGDLRLLAGIRRTFDHKMAYITNELVDSITGGRTPSSAGCTLPYREPDLDYASTTYRAGLQYDITPDIMAYVQWQNGFKTGGYGPSTCTTPFRPEKITDWEVGVKSTLFDGTMILNIGLFSYNYTDMQVVRNLPTTSVIDNAAKSKIKGAEIESVVNFTDDLRGNINIGILDSKYEGYSAALVVGGPLLNLSGNQLMKAPNLTVGLGLEYTMHLADLGELKPRVEANYTSRTYYSAFNTVDNKQDAYWLVNLFVTFTPDNCPYSFQAFVKNVGNRPYRTGSFFSGTFGNDNGYWGAPRLFGAEATIKF